MRAKNKKLDFRNQIIFIGIDVHKKSLTMTIHIAGQQIRTFSTNPNPFNPTNIIAYSIPKTEYVKIKRFNSLGQRL